MLDNNSLASWLYQPYINLGTPIEGGPFHPYGIEFAFKNLTEDKTIPRIQSILMPTFREVLFKTIGIDVAFSTTPDSLPEELQTPRWRQLSTYIKNYKKLSPEQKVNVCWLLIKMCFYEYVLLLIPESVMEKVSKSESLAQLAYFRTLARYTLNLEKKSSYNLNEFEHIANYAPRGTVVKVNAYYQLVVQNVKHHYNVEKVDYWLPIFLKEIEVTKSSVDRIVYLQLRSRYHRVAGFLPQMRNDKQGVIREMNHAEEVAINMPRKNLFQKIISDEMLYPVLESRTKEALWLGDLELAEKRALKLVQLCPIEPRARMHLGQIQIENGKIESALESYLLAIRYAPPGEEIAWFMAGQCYENLSRRQEALNAYLKSFQLDPNAISSIHKVFSLSKKIKNKVITQWSENTIRYLSKIERQKKINLKKVQAYQIKMFGEKGEKPNT